MFEKKSNLQKESNKNLNNDVKLMGKNLQKLLLWKKIGNHTIELHCGNNAYPTLLGILLCQQSKICWS